MPTTLVIPANRARPARATLFFLILALALPFASRAQQPFQLPAKPLGYVSDFANVLSPDAKAKLTALCTEVDQKAKAQIAVVTVPTIGDQSAFDYSYNLATKWGVGPKQVSRGVLILYATNDHKYWTTVGYGLEGILPDGKVGGFGREAVPLLRAGNYDGAITLMVQSIADVIATDRGITLSTTAMGSSQSRPQPARPAAPHLTIGEIIGIVFVLFWVFGLLSRLFGGPDGRRGGMGGLGNFGAGWIIGNMMGGGFRGGWGGGGFG